MSTQVEMVLNMLKPVVVSLSVTEKAELLAELQQLLEINSKDSSATPSSSQHQSSTVSGVSFGSGNSAFNFSPVQSREGDVSVSPSFTQTSTQNADLQQALSKLAQLRQSIDQSEELNSLTKEGAKAQIEQLEGELQKPKPDKGVVERTIATLKQGLEGILTLAKPTMEVASLVAKVWGIPIP